MGSRYWIGTLPYATEPSLYDRLDEFFQSGAIQYAVGQRELGAGGFDHWQFVINLKKPQRISALKKLFGQCHWEPCRSERAEQYCQKSDTAVEGSQFKVGEKRMQRGDSKDWASIYDSAKCGQLESIPPDVLIRCYSAIRRIGADNLKPTAIERKVFVYWGATGVGKSRRAWEEAGLDAYPKDPRTKFWDGYSGHSNVVIDEFRGGIDISHMLRWLDRYPTIVEVKGSSTVLKATHIWITSNLDPRLWYPELDEDTKEALLRRLEIKHFVLYKKKDNV